MHIITKFLIKQGFIEMNDSLLKRWAQRKKIKSLSFALKNAHYTSRSYAAQLLGQFNHPLAIQALYEALDDSISYVSIAAIQSLEKLPVSAEVRLKIRVTKQYWERLQPQIKALKAKTNGGMAGFYERGIPSPEGFINSDNSGCYGP